jgi:hypothetical protein
MEIVYLVLAFISGVIGIMCFGKIAFNIGRSLRE